MARAFRRIQVGFEILRAERFHLLVLDFRHHAPVVGIADQQPFLHRPVQGTVGHGVDTPYRGTAETGFFPLLFPRPPAFQQVLVELLNLPTGELVQLDGSDPWDGILLNSSFVVPCGRWPDAGFGVQFEPQPQPLCHGVLSGAGHVQLLALRDGHRQFGLDLRLGLAQHILDDPLAGPGIVPSILTFTQICLPLPRMFLKKTSHRVLL